MAGLENSFFCYRGEPAEPRWYAAYTCSRHEKRVAEQLQSRDIECYLPVYAATRRWNNRRAHVELPLLPGYVFVRLPRMERLRVLEIPGVVHLIGSGTSPIPLPDEDIEQIRRSLSCRDAEPHPYIGPGQRVRIVLGPLAGIEGVVLRQNGCNRFVLSVDLIMRSIAVNVEAAELETAEHGTPTPVAA